jgi:hypothetical protein
MDVDKLTEKVLRWLSDPKGREFLRSLIYVLLPLIVLSLIRTVRRAQVAKKEAAAITPRIRGSGTQSLATAETLRETMAKEKKKVERELEGVFGRRERLLTKARGGGVPSQLPAQPRLSESPGPDDDQAVREDLIRMFFGRRRE